MPLPMGTGPPTHDPDPATTGTLHGDKITPSTSTPGPAMHGTRSEHMPRVQAEQATRIALNPVLLGSSRQNPTNAATHTETASHLLKPTLPTLPALPALIALTIRGRIKRSSRNDPIHTH
ncbi:hypothetical protein [Streptomyces lutosisoli]|uniref:Uncharacterized protein n=1 Tax=Streptomyces lutosisoli TaxID=2665721 RepID=A0ABW2VV58_9ACTN